MALKLWGLGFFFMANLHFMFRVSPAEGLHWIEGFRVSGLGL